MNKVVNNHSPNPPSEGLSPEDWPFEDDCPNIISFDEILGEHTIEPREGDSDRSDEGDDA